MDFAHKSIVSKESYVKTKSNEVMEIVHRVMATLDPHRRVESLAALEIASTLFSVAANSLATAVADSDRLARRGYPSALQGSPSEGR